MAKINHLDANPKSWKLRPLALQKDCPNVTFGELIYIHRSCLRLSQRQVAQGASLSEGYFSELENSKRIAPPRATALRIARALHLSEQDEDHLVDIAVWERTSLQNDLHLPTVIQQLITLLRVQGTRMPSDVLNSVKEKLLEVRV